MSRPPHISHAARDPLDQTRAPILETLSAYLAREVYPFHTPGHKGGRFTAPELLELWGPATFDYDLPAMTATDNTLHPIHCIKEAQELAAELFGAAATFFTGGGASTAIAAMVLAAVPPGETILLARNVHRSIASALVLSGARPRFIAQTVLPECGALAVDPQLVEAGLRQEPRPVAVLLTRPSYYGLAGPLEPIAAICRRYGVPLLVDEAHGPHLAFLPAGGPSSALAGGADLAAQSVHKTLGALVGSAQLHVGKQSPISPEQVRDAFNFLHTTSPNYLQLASLDAVRRHIALRGREQFARAVDEVEQLAAAIDALNGLRVLRPERDPQLANHRRDPLRIAINVAATGWTGYDVELLLRNEYRIEDEMSDWFNVVLVLSPHDDDAARQRLLAGLAHVSRHPRTIQASSINADRNLLQPAVPPLAMTPRDAALGPKQAVPLPHAVGRVCAESVMFYPPGIPLVMPGETVTDDVLAACRALLAGGAHCYAADTTLGTIRCVNAAATGDSIAR